MKTRDLSSNGNQAPNEIWAFYDADLADDNNGADIIAHDAVQHGGQRYVRADLYDALKQELDGVIAMIGDTKATNE